jgi:glycosyltransferase involved in cell wall biosynthesis
MTVSAIIPVFNRTDYLQETLQSVFLQTRKPDEVIVVDDCSTEPVGERIAKLDLLGSRVTLLRTDGNRGVAGARNWGWRHAKGDLLAFLDSDDIWMAEKTQTQVEFLAAHAEIDGVYGAMEAFWPDGRTEPWAHDRPPRVSAESALVDANMTVQTLMIRRKALEVLGGFDERFGILDDQDIAIRMGTLGLRIIFFTHPVLTRLRRHDSNFSSHAGRYFKEECRILWENRRLSRSLYGPGSARVHLGRAVKRLGTKVRFAGLPTRVLAQVLYESAPKSVMPRI